jgi:hypothetical protein
MPGAVWFQHRRHQGRDVRSNAQLIGAPNLTAGGRSTGAVSHASSSAPRPGKYFFGLIGKCQWRLVAVRAWCCGEKKSGELCFE